MPYAFKVARVTFSGSVFANTEQWSTSMYLGFEDGDVGPITPGVAEAIYAPWIGFYTTGGVNISGSCYHRQVKVALLNTDGSTDVDNIDYFLSPTPVAGGGNTTMHPAQISLAATLIGSHPRGLASKGRMFLPGINSSVDTTTGKITPTTQGNIADALQIFFDAIPGLSGIPGKPILASDPATAADPTRVGRNGLIEEIRVGSVFDTQRRRRNGLQEGYVTRPITNP